MESPDAEPVHHHHTGRPWLDTVLGVSAMLVSFVSIFLALHNGRAMERLVEANSWPFVQIIFTSRNPDGTPHVHFDLANKGVGPARIVSLEVMFDGVPMSDARHLLNAILHRTTAPPHPTILSSDLVNGVLAPRETSTVVDFSPVQEYSSEDYETIRSSFGKLKVKSCYCSAFDECWLADTVAARPSKVNACPAPLQAFQ